MSASITVLNANRSEWDLGLQNLKVDSNYNIIINCVYNLDNFDEEMAFLNDPALDKNTLVVFWQPVEKGVDTHMFRLAERLRTVPVKSVFLSGGGHKINSNNYFPKDFNIQFYPIFDLRSANMWWSSGGAQAFDVNREHKFMYLNSKDTAHRRYIFGKLLENNLMEQGIVSYNCREGLCNTELDFHSGVDFTDQQFNECQRVFDLCTPAMPRVLDGGGFAGNLKRAVWLSAYAGIVGETDFINRGFNTSFVTEKTFNTIANNQIPFIVGHAGSLELLRSLGYKSYSDVVDESYDTIVHNGNRLEAVAQEIVRFLSRPIEAIQQDYARIQTVIEYNRDLLFSQHSDNNESFNARFQKMLDTL